MTTQNKSAAPFAFDPDAPGLKDAWAEMSALIVAHGGKAAPSVEAAFQELADMKPGELVSRLAGGPQRK